MFNSLDGGSAPVLVLTVLASWWLAKLCSIWLRLALAILVPVGISLGWFFVPRLPLLFKPLEFNQDPWVPWGLAAAIVWSVYAVPVGLISTFIFAIWNRRRRSNTG
jgi:hypothetical protein